MKSFRGCHCHPKFDEVVGEIFLEGSTLELLPKKLT
jgi:hypothetical protein